MMLPGIWAQVMFDAGKNFLSGQDITHIPVYIIASTFLLHCFTCWLFVVYCGWGDLGVALSTNLAFFLNFGVCEVYMVKSKFLR